MTSVEQTTLVDSKRLTSASYTAGLLGLVLLISFLLPLPGADGTILGLPSICPFYEMTGLPCPGCGLTRSFVCFAHLHLTDALRWNLLGPPLWLLFLFLFARALVTVIKRRPILPFSQTLIDRSSFAALAVLLLFGAGRMLLLTIQHKHF